MSNAILEVNYQIVRSVLTAKSIPAQFGEDQSRYIICAVDAPLVWKCEILKSNQNADLIDFETNLKPYGNTVLDPRIDNFPMSRPATTKNGWHYCPRYITWTTAKYNSLHNRKIDLTTDYGDATLKFFNSSGTELKREDYLSDLLFQAALDVNCARTALDWHSTFDFDLIGCVFLNGQRPSNPTWGNVIAAPDIPANYGGSVPFLDGGFPLHLLGDYSFIDFHGITTKRVIADAITKSNKFRLLIDHGTTLGLNATMSMGFKKFNL